MEFSKYDNDVKQEIESILNVLEYWKELFSINYEFYIDGWAIYLREKRIYPRLIVLFRSERGYSLKSYEIHLMRDKEIRKEIFSLEHIANKEEALEEVKNVIYGKDLIKKVKQKLNLYFS